MPNELEIQFLNSDFEVINILDTFNSLIWIDRYYSYGDFELVVNPTNSIWSDIETTAYFKLNKSDRLMIPEDFLIRTKIEDGDELIITGRSLESILDRRIIWTPTTVTGYLQAGIQGLLDSAIISPTISEREISNFQFTSSTDPIVTALLIDTQFSGENLYEVISTLCISRDIGFRILLTPNGLFDFMLYAGVDRSYDQTTYPYLVFSPEFDNLLSSDYTESIKSLKTIVLVAGEKGVGNTRITNAVTVSGGGGSGLTRRELYKEANDVSRNTPSGQLTDQQYLYKLYGKGIEELGKNIILKEFDCEVDFTAYSYGVDFFMGDVLQVSDKYGNMAKSRVTEIVFFQDPSGSKIYPKFVITV